MRGDGLRQTSSRRCAAEELLPKLFAGPVDPAVRRRAPSSTTAAARRNGSRVSFACSGADEVRALLAEQGHVELKCEFCNRAFRYDDAQVGAIMRGTAQASSAVH